MEQPSFYFVEWSIFVPAVELPEGQSGSGKRLVAGVVEFDVCLAALVGQAEATRACLTKISGVVPETRRVSRFQLLSDAQWSLIEDLLPVRTGKRGRPFQDARSMVEGIIYRYRCGIAWRDVPEVFGPWQSIWTWHRRMSADGTWDVVLARLLAAADEAGMIDWAVAVDSTIARAHQHATNLTRDTGGWVELHESGDRAA